MLLSPHLAEQLMWSRFVNVHGLPGHNISCDLHMEHLNCLVKIAIEGLGANKSMKAISRAAKAIGVLRLRVGHQVASIQIKDLPKTSCSSSWNVMYLIPH